MLHTLSKFIFASMFSVLSACSSIESNQPSEKSTTFHFGYQQDSVLAHYFEAYGEDPKTITGFY
ncbi:phospholipase D family protein, partial [Vibrio chemaguriensis]|nr:phospholipase D family protein [Vibrio chemaguriensis]